MEQPMRRRILHVVIAATALLGAMTPSRSEVIMTLNWGTAIDTLFYNSFSNALYLTPPDYTNSYPASTWELGTFVTGFTPTMSNITQWEANWRVYDVAGFNPGGSNDPSLFSGYVDMLTGGFSGSTNAAANTNFSFFGLNAYIWGYQDGFRSYAQDLQWLLFRATNWAFATNYNPDPVVPALEWNYALDINSTNDAEVVFGRIWFQDDMSNDITLVGGGYASDPIFAPIVGYPDVLQLYTLEPVPEASTLAVGAMLVAFAFYRKWRGRSESRNNKTTV